MRGQLLDELRVKRVGECIRRIAELPEDARLLAEARRETLALIGRESGLGAPELAPLVDAARERFGDERTEGIAA